jgi:hypothetical protein
MGNFIGSKKCSICKKNQATTYRNIADKEYFICDSEKCSFLSLLRAGVLKKKDLSYLNLEIPKIKGE